MLFDAPLWLSGIVLVLGLAGFSLAAQKLARRWVVPRLHMGAHEGEYPSMIIHSVMVFYALVAALVAVSVWERYTLVHERASNEASTIASVWRDLGGYPSPVRENLRDLLRGYTEFLIHDAWPEYRKGRIPPEGSERLDRFQDELMAFEPHSESQKILHAETLRAYNQMVLARRLRVDTVGVGLPVVIWMVVILGGLISICASVLFPLADTRYQAILVMSLSTLIALVVLMILALDQPFQGDLGIGPESLERVHDHLMTR